MARTSCTRTWLRVTMTKAFPRMEKPPTFTYSAPIAMGRYPEPPGFALISIVVFADPRPRSVVLSRSVILSEHRKFPSSSSTTPPWAAAIASLISRSSPAPSQTKSGVPLGMTVESPAATYTWFPLIGAKVGWGSAVAGNCRVRIPSVRVAGNGAGTSTASDGSGAGKTWPYPADSPAAWSRVPPGSSPAARAANGRRARRITTRAGRTRRYCIGVGALWERMCLSKCSSRAPPGGWSPRVRGRKNQR